VRGSLRRIHHRDTERRSVRLSSRRSPQPKVRPHARMSPRDFSQQTGLARIVAEWSRASILTNTGCARRIRPSYRHSSTRTSTRTICKEAKLFSEKFSQENKISIDSSTEDTKGCRKSDFCLPFQRQYRWPLTDFSGRNVKRASSPVILHGEAAEGTLFLERASQILTTCPPKPAKAEHEDDQWQASSSRLTLQEHEVSIGSNTEDHVFNDGFRVLTTTKSLTLRVTSVRFQCKAVASIMLSKTDSRLP
jgi:hypothetical protein